MTAWLTPPERQEIQKLAREGYTASEIARRYGRDRSTISYVIRKTVPSDQRRRNGIPASVAQEIRWLHFAEDISVTEIARRLGLDRTTVVRALATPQARDLAELVAVFNRRCLICRAPVPFDHGPSICSVECGVQWVSTAPEWLEWRRAKWDQMIAEQEQVKRDTFNRLIAEQAARDRSKQEEIEWLNQGKQTLKHLRLYLKKRNPDPPPSLPEASTPDTTSPI